MLTVMMLSFSACSADKQSTRQKDVRQLNRQAYLLRYHDVERSALLAREAWKQSDGTSAVALLNMGYVAYQEMDFERVDSLLHKLRAMTHNQVVLLCADVMEMKTVQRTNEYATFFQAKHDAQRRILRIEEERSDLTQEDEQLFVYAQSEYHIIASTYYYYRGQDSLSLAEICEMKKMRSVHTDTAQWIYYNYMMGSGGMIESDSEQEIILSEFDYMMSTYMQAHDGGYLYFEANALQSLAVMLDQHADVLRTYRNEDVQIMEVRMGMPPADSLSFALCRKSINLFSAYGDTYQTACALRTMGELEFRHGNYERSLDNYAQALSCVNRHHLRYYHDTCDTLCLFDSLARQQSTELKWMLNPSVKTVPDWIAAIRQQISKTYSAMGMKAESDFNRNAYLDILSHTNQNEEYQSRKNELDRQARRTTLQAVFLLLLFVLFVILLYFYRRRINIRLQSLAQELEDMKSGKTIPDDVRLLAEQEEEFAEQLAMSQMNLKKNKCQNVENRARVSMVHAVVPYVDRIAGEVLRMKREQSVRPERREYVLELADQIMQYNDILTEWIRVQQGQLALRIRTIHLQSLFDIVQESRYTFEQKGISLNVEPTAAFVKGDEALTLFMINTLADNARKFTPQGGSVNITAQAAEEYVEVQVSDTGIGLSEADLDTLNNTMVYDPQSIGSPDDEQKGFGFGLANCRGIIEKYKKYSSIFSACAFGVRNNTNGGCTFFFRLPRVLSIMLLFLCMPFCAMADAKVYYDSLYQSNLQGKYHQAKDYGELALKAMDSRLQIVDDDAVAIEVQEFLHGVDMDYQLVLGIRNELALAALALNDWQMYEYNNTAYTQLQKLLNQDETLPLYCQRMEAYQQNARLLLVFSVLFLLLVLLMLYRLLINRRLVAGKDIERETEQYHEHLLTQQQQQVDSICDQLSRSQYEDNRIYVQNQVLSNCLSTIKHESMYYPARIQSLAATMVEKDIDTLDELVSYYRKVYAILCSQADDQVAQPGFKRQILPAGQVLGLLSQAARKAKLQVELENAAIDDCVCADEMLITCFAQHLLENEIWQTDRISVRANSEQNFVNFEIILHGVDMDAERATQLFNPQVEHLSLYVARQIIREHDTYCGNPGLRLYAQNSAEGCTIHFTLLKSKKI